MVKFMSIIITFLLCTTYVRAQQDSTEVDPYLELADLIAAEEGPLEKCKDYVRKKEWKEFEKKHHKW